MKLQEICQEIGVNFDGKNIEIEGLHTLKEANSYQLSFFHNKKYIKDLSSTKAGAVLIEEQYAKLLPKNIIPLITEEPYLKLALASKLFAYKIVTKGDHPEMGRGCDIDKRVRFGKNVVLGDNVTVMASSYIGDNVKIGSNTIIYPNVTIYHHSTVGESCILHSGVVIGSDGYGFAHTKNQKHIKIYHNGNVIIEDDVEIGANSTVDRAVFGTTHIREGVKIDNLVQIGHNCDIGKNSLLVGQTGLAGSTVVGKGVIFGGQSGTAGHLNIGDFAVIAGKSGVTKSLKGGKRYGGFPAMEHSLWLKLQSKIRGLIRKKRG